MAEYLVSQIIKGNITYAMTIRKFSKYKEQIDSILLSEGRDDLISE